MQTSSIPTAIYVRLSQDRALDGLGVARQENECRALLDRMPDHEEIGVYSDNDISASSGRVRPAYQRMLEDIRAGKVNAVVAWHTDRLHRSPRELETYIDTEVPTYTVAAGPLDLATPMGRMAARTHGAVARYEIEQKSVRQKAKNRQSAHAGRMGGGRVPFGYNDDRLTVNPEPGLMIRAAYKALLGGASLGSVIRAWNDSEHTAPRGGRWTYSTVRGVLVRPLNAGLVQYDGTVLTAVPGEWEPLVNEDSYYALKALMADPKRRTTTGRERKHLLAGLLSCESCGQTMKSGMVTSRGKKSLLYRCGNAECTQPLAVAREQINEMVIERFLAERGNLRTARLVTEDNGAALADLEARIAGLTARLGEDEADVVPLIERLSELKSERAALRSAGGSLSLSAMTVAQEWAEAENVTQRAELLRSHLSVLSVAPRGKTSHRFDPKRVTLQWAETQRMTLDGEAISALPTQRRIRLMEPVEIPRKGDVVFSV